MDFEAPEHPLTALNDYMQKKRRGGATSLLEWVVEFDESPHVRIWKAKLMLGGTFFAGSAKTKTGAMNVVALEVLRRIHLGQLNP
ncbi:hypothetical protein BOTBODRAFT_55214 [Botryobasidium botryosum FD-172 SS1]|uniref:DRBM domain-containing protein n=1 Tax=Botryobasidium botryosum (strain FD-172 SS1) TaxID=930990 RepID=A0A067MGP0_BOTB1|nr:hypothetical protein BOTBODRAFT_55214 [Botryobasidium botryosum FD-172 SS1]